MDHFWRRPPHIPDRVLVLRHQHPFWPPHRLSWVPRWVSVSGNTPALCCLQWECEVQVLCWQGVVVQLKQRSGKVNSSTYAHHEATSSLFVHSTSPVLTLQFQRSGPLCCSVGGSFHLHSLSIYIFSCSLLNSILTVEADLLTFFNSEICRNVLYTARPTPVCRARELLCYVLWFTVWFKQSHRKSTRMGHLSLSWNRTLLQNTAQQLAQVENFVSSKMVIVSKQILTSLLLWAPFLNH